MELKATIVPPERGKWLNTTNETHLSKTPLIKSIPLKNYSKTHKEMHHQQDLCECIKFSALLINALSKHRAEAQKITPPQK
jgi:hypothetical protein